jgi:hypothetical protein
MPDEKGRWEGEAGIERGREREREKGEVRRAIPQPRFTLRGYWKAAEWKSHSTRVESISSFPSYDSKRESEKRKTKAEGRREVAGEECVQSFRTFRNPILRVGSGKVGQRVAISRADRRTDEQATLLLNLFIKIAPQ